MKCVEIFRDGDHRWMAFGQDPNKPEQVIDTNQYVITSGSEAMMIDPGGSEIFPNMVAAMTARVPVDNVRHIMISHQDPDIGSSLGLWRRICREDVNIHLSWMWAGFVAHFDREGRYCAVPDEGHRISLAGREMRMLPAHYLHSPGNYSLYDPAARILFSGDIGAAILPADRRGAKSFFVEDFDSHIGYMRPFHERWMPSAAARDAWVSMVSSLKVDMIAPQHGLIFRGDDVGRFLNWFKSVEVGKGLNAFSAAGSAKAFQAGARR
jgi:flavorubredoxin